MVAQWITIIGGICMALFPPLAYTEYALPLLLPLSKVSLQLSNSPACLFPIPSFYSQYISICRKRNATGFSTDIPGLLSESPQPSLRKVRKLKLIDWLALALLTVVANVTRCIYWLGERFQIYLLIQSILMIFAQFGQFSHSLPSRQELFRSLISIHDSGILYVCILYRDPTVRIKQSRRPGNLWQWEIFPPSVFLFSVSPRTSLQLNLARDSNVGISNSRLCWSCCIAQCSSSFIESNSTFLY